LSGFLRIKTDFLVALRPLLLDFKRDLARLRRDVDPIDPLKASKTQLRSIASFHAYAMHIHPPEAVLIRTNQKEVAARPPKNPF